MTACTACGAEVAAHKWGQIKAHAAGWFFAKNGTAYCPDHVPDWVAKWRGSKL